jgi:hypothetical protein
MADRPSKEYQAFTNLVDSLLTVPKEEIRRRHAAHKAQSDANPRKRGPKPKVTPSASAPGEDIENG